MVLTAVTEEPVALEQGSPTTELIPLVEQIRQRQPAALEALYEQTVQKVFSVAMALLDNRADAEEVTEDVFIQAWHQADRFDVHRGGVIAWLSTICRSRALDALRSRRRQRKVHDAVKAEPATTSWTEEPLLIQGSSLEVALATLSDGQRQVLALAYFHGLTHQEIADRLGMKLGTVKTHVRRALLTLRTRLAS